MTNPPLPFAVVVAAIKNMCTMPGHPALTFGTRNFVRGKNRLKGGKQRLKACFYFLLLSGCTEKVPKSSSYPFPAISLILNPLTLRH